MKSWQRWINHSMFLNKEVDIFGTTMSVRNFIISMIAHCHEHLGQSIAYQEVIILYRPGAREETVE